MQFKTQTFTIADLYNWYLTKELFLQPRFQRRKVWKPIARSYLIDTIVRGLPMPKIYFRVQVDPQTVKSVREIVDGQQRLDAIFGYIEGKFALSRSHDSIAAGKRFTALPEHLRKAILSYDLSADLLIGADDPQVLQVFARINSYSVTLNAQEKRNAKFFGLFKELAYSLGTAHVAFWMDNSILTDQAIARMGEAELTSELLIGILAGLQDKKSSLDRYYKSYEDVFPDAKMVRDKFEKVIAWLQGNAMGQLGGTVFQRRALFYSLFLAVADAMFGIEGESGPIAGFARTLTQAQGKSLRTQLRQLSDAARSEEPPRHLAQFATASARQTDNVKPRRIRHRRIFKILKAL
jgi:Protein of unknown function DUF262